MWKVSGIKSDFTPRCYFFFAGGHVKFEEITHFFVKRSLTENFRHEIFLGRVPMELPGTQLSEYLYERGVQQIFDCVLVAQSRLRVVWFRLGSD